MPNSVWKRIRADAGLIDVRIHDLRHFYASVAISSGKTVLTVGKLRGHNQPETTSNMHATPKSTWNGRLLRWMLFLGRHRHERGAVDNVPCETTQTGNTRVFSFGYSGVVLERTRLSVRHKDLVLDLSLHHRRTHDISWKEHCDVTRRCPICLSSISIRRHCSMSS